MAEQLNEAVEKHRTGKEKRDEIHLLDLAIVLARHKKLVAGLPVATGLIALVVSLMMTPIFTGTVKILPPQQNSGGLAAAMLNQLGGLSGVAGSMAGLKSPNDLYVGILESRTIADSLINRFKLRERYEVDTMDEARNALDKIVDIGTGKKDGIISISVDDQDPKFAAELANAYVDELEKLTQSMAISEASQRRLFFERQLKQTKDQLADAEVALRKMQEKTGMIQPDGQVQAIIGKIAELKGMIAAKEVQIKAMRTFAAAQNPDLMRIQEELNALRVQLAQLERNRPNKEGDFMVPAGNLPEAGVEYVRRMRDVKYYETLFEMLAKQYELAKVDEAKDSSSLQVLDKAVPAERKTKPKRTVIMLLGIFAGGMLGICLAFMRDTYMRSRNAGGNRERWNALSTALFSRRT